MNIDAPRFSPLLFSGAVTRSCNLPFRFVYARLQRREVSKLTVESGLIKYSIDGVFSLSLFELCKWGE